ncbi:mitochondrial import translocase, subunit Tom22 [Coprinellus micaceus]|uniref:Mitochondrial import translocase, subunit Tom22 n=1 Tax=Coprinellus micaceus TaxID=71717 RepID=A0A4Y7U0G8_COPMI|nr:mitochondrial import translocase, subunit Tom22 [Coprinellus micaceus]
MVKVEIVEEKDEHTSPNSPYASSSSSRTGSTDSLSSVESLDLNVDESVFDRVAALVDIVPPSTRHSIATKVSKTASVVKKTSKVVGNLVWIVTTSALLVVLPLALALEDDAKLAAQEREMLEQQQGAQASPKLLAGGPSPFPPADQQQPKGLVPPGF